MCKFKIYLHWGLSFEHFKGDFSNKFTWQLTLNTWHRTPEAWHMTHDTWHQTCDMWCGVNLFSKFQVSIFYSLGVMMFWRVGGKGWLNSVMSDKGVCITAPDIQGLLNTRNARKLKFYKKHRTYKNCTEKSLSSYAVILTNVWQFYWFKKSSKS